MAKEQQAARDAKEAESRGESGTEHAARDEIEVNLVSAPSIKIQAAKIARSEFPPCREL